MTDNFLASQRGLLAQHRGLLAQQSGVITRGQALAAGFTDKAIEVRLATGRWQRLYPGVYATFSGEPSRAARLWAAVLRAGTGAALSHQTAAELYGLADSPAPLIHVTVPSGSAVVRPPGVLIHYSGRLAQSRHPVLTPPRTRIDDTVLDIAQHAATLDEAVSLALRAVGSRRTTAALLRTAIQGRPRLRWRTDLVAALGEEHVGAHSLLEYRYGSRVEGPHGLPRGTRQRPVTRGGRREYQDIAYDEYQTVVELDGQAAHPGQSRWRDLRRDNLNAAHGLVTLRLGWVDVTERACASAGVVGATLAHRGWPGMPRQCGPTCRLPPAP
ncbi:MAG TPA: hypothetical protein DHU96_07555 [Actinobacteria bacterium]|nr:hypothetical protein [Actinomycetota bacterium]